MTNLVMLLVVCVVAVAMVQAQNPPFRGNSGSFNCPQERGQFEFAGDCTKFYQCDGGFATLSNCPNQLIFNSRTSFCDWPHSVPNPNCAGGASPLTPQTSQICRNNPGNPTEAFIAPHPDLCNAFYTCSSSYLFAPCTFCGEGMYYNAEAGGCRDYVAAGLDLQAVCQGRQFIAHGDKVFRQMDGSCWPYSNLANPFQPLVDALRNGPRPTQRPG